MARSQLGHASITWSIVLEAEIARPINPGEVRDRLAAAWPADGSVGPEPRVDLMGDEDGDPVSVLADRRFPEAGPFCEILLAPGDRPRVVIGAHHAVVDGLGLVGVLSAALGEPLGTTARGAPQALSRPRRAAAVGYPIRRLVEALVAPPARIVPPRADGPAGDHLVRAGTEVAPVRTPDLLASAAALLQAWNRERGAPARRIVVAVGASLRPGRTPGIRRAATWYRVRVDPSGSPTAMEDLSRRSPEPRPAGWVVRLAERSRLAGRLDERTGSSLLVSNLGRLDPTGPVVDAAFYPAAHGRSGVAVGAVGLGDRTVLTLRARRRDFERADVVDLLSRLVADLESRAAGATGRSGRGP